MNQGKTQDADQQQLDLSGGGKKGSASIDSQAKRQARPVFPGSLPVWGAETLTPPVSDPFEPAVRRTDTSVTFRDKEKERGCLPMARIARIAAALSALATIFLVTGAGSKY